jgi:TPP-dependent pyruvate/acetoin dehydrogenase alpha subunit
MLGVLDFCNRKIEPFFPEILAILVRHDPYPPYTLIRALDDDGRACREWDPDLASENLLKGLRAMLLTRLFDGHLFKAHRQGKCSFYIKSAGEKAIGAAQSLTLAADDMAFPTYRLLSWLMARDYRWIWSIKSSRMPMTRCEDDNCRCRIRRSLTDSILSQGM